MRIERLGDGPPEVAVVGAVHGDEPCGALAIERLLADAPAVERPVALVVANESALERGVRYVDEDLNRAFPGDPEASSHEGRLAHRLRRELRDCVTLSMHSTQSHDAPFAIVQEVDALAEAICPHLSVAAVVESADFSEGRLIEHADVVEVECGLQGSEAAAENASRLVREFLGAVGALRSPDSRAARADRRDESAAGDDRRPTTGEGGTSGTVRATGTATSDATSGPADDDARGARGGPDATPGGEPGVPVLRLVERIPKVEGTEHAVFVENFERVAAGEPYAATDGETLVAEEPFYPVLLSPYGYEDQFGYAATLVGRLAP